MTKKKKTVILVIILILVVAITATALGIYLPRNAKAWGFDALLRAEIISVKANCPVGVGPDYHNMDVPDPSRAIEMLTHFGFNRYGYSQRLTRFSPSNHFSLDIETEVGTYSIYAHGLYRINGKYYKIETRCRAWVKDVVWTTGDEAAAEIDKQYRSTTSSTLSTSARQSAIL